jgi:hypothetical protein
MAVPVSYYSSQLEDCTVLEEEEFETVITCLLAYY